MCKYLRLVYVNILLIFFFKVYLFMGFVFNIFVYIYLCIYK